MRKILAANKFVFGAVDFYLLALFFSNYLLDPFKCQIILKNLFGRTKAKLKEINKEILFWKIMHTDLAPHLHTPHCNQLIAALKNCHEQVSLMEARNLYNNNKNKTPLQNTFGKFLGICNSFDSEVVKCLKQERIARSAANRAKARERQAEIKKKVNQAQ